MIADQIGVRTPSSSRPKPLTIKQVALRWDVTDRTVRAWIADGLPAHLIGGRKWLLDTDVQVYFTQHIEDHPGVKTRRKIRREKKDASS